MKKKDSKVLVIHDRSAFRGELANQVKELGYEVDSVKNVHLGLKKIFSGEFCFIISALYMEEMSGFDLLKVLKLDDEYRFIPVVIVMNMQKKKDVARCIQMGADWVFPEDDGTSLLKACIRSGLKRKSLYDQREKYYKNVESRKKRSDSLIAQMIPIGIALFSEKIFDRLLENILLESMNFCNADAGTLYLRTEDDRLEFNILRTNSLNIFLGGVSGSKTSYESIPMLEEKSGHPNFRNVVSYVANTGKTCNIQDAYDEDGFDFLGTRAFDKKNNYRSKSFLTVPLKNIEDKVIGVLQLINAMDPETDKVTDFSEEQKKVIEVLGKLAATALQLYIREKKLNEKIMELQVVIDKKARDKKVKQITDTDYFQSLQEKLKAIRSTG